MAYQFIHIDRSASDLSYYATKYRDLRLKALKESPGSFSSTWADESAYTDDIWVSRLRDPESEIFACVYSSPDQAPEWVGQVILHGPVPAAEFALPPESGQIFTSVDAADEKWQMRSLYTSASHRGKKLGPRLCQRAMQFLSEERAVKGVNATIRVMIKPDNEISIRMYRGLGFTEIGKCTLEEGLRANDEKHLIPKGPLGEKYTTRIGIVMTLRIQSVE